MLFAALTERTLPRVLHALYLLTAFRICSFRAWRAAGSPNPFLPKDLKIILADLEKRANGMPDATPVVRKHGFTPSRPLAQDEDKSISQLRTQSVAMIFHRSHLVDL